MILQDNWGPLSRKEADEWTNGSSDLLDFLLWTCGVIAPFLGAPGFVVSAFDLLAIIAIDEVPFHEGDYGSDTIYYDPDQGQYWRLVYHFDEDGNLLSYQCYFSWDGTNWTLVANMTDYYPSVEEDEKQ